MRRTPPSAQGTAAGQASSWRHRPWPSCPRVRVRVRVRERVRARVRGRGRGRGRIRGRGRGRGRVQVRHVVRGVPDRVVGEEVDVSAAHEVELHGEALRAEVCLDQDEGHA